MPTQAQATSTHATPTPAPAISTQPTLAPAPSHPTHARPHPADASQTAPVPPTLILEFAAPTSSTSAATAPNCTPPLPDTPIPITPTANAPIPSPTRTIRHHRSRSDKGAITAEYAVLIVGVCGFGGAMVALLRSPAMQAVLKGIVNFGLKLAGVEGVHL
ncbi:DUF4244 domain-containing protein [Kribbella sp. NPDC059898]|uniref:DUF4244 domain-containing protein n=1 Tax=Kribbella sp. NPDC059898 TaxID=3346995 RepID=UPI00364B07FD